MRISFFCLIVLLFYTSTAYAQPEHAAVKATLEKAESIVETQPNAAFALIDFSEDDVLALNDKQLNLLYYLVLTLYYFNIEDYHTSEKFLALAFHNVDNNFHAQTRLQIIECYIVSWRGETKKAIELSDKAISLARIADDNILLMQALGLKATLLSSVGRFQEAIELISEIYRYINTTDDTIVRSNIYSVIAEVYKNVGDVKSSLDYQLQSIEYRKAHPSTTNSDMVIAYYNLAFNYFDSDDFDRAEIYFELSGNLAEQEGDKLSVAFANVGLAQIAASKEEHQRVIDLLLGKAEHFDKAHIFGMQITTRMLLLHAYVKLNRLREAKKLLTEIRNLRKDKEEAGNFSAQLNEIEASYYAAHSDYKSAYLKLKSYVDLMQAFYAKDKKQKIEKIAVGLKIDQQELENEFLFSENQKKAALNALRQQQVTSLLIASGLMLAVLLILLFVLRNNYKLKVKLEHYAQTDKLTGLFNRGYFDWMANKYFDSKKWRTFCVALLDVDHFKSINDTYGHDVGDTTLQKIAEIAGANIRDNDILARYGGEEFIILFRDTDINTAAAVLERIRNNLARTRFDAITDRQITVSAGIAQKNDSDHSLQRIITRADKALYDAKNTGRDRVVLDQHEIVSGNRREESL